MLTKNDNIGVDVEQVEDVYVEWQKRFVLNCEHYLEAHTLLDGQVHITDCCKRYYWQEDKVYDLIGPFVRDLIREESCGDALLWGRGGIVDRLIPYQQRYNTIENQIEELTSRLVLGVLVVEDGSLDIDELSEEGLAPGKILWYRQGAKAPSMLQDSANQVELLKQLCSMRDTYKKNLEDLIDSIRNEVFWGSVPPNDDKNVDGGNKV